MSTYTHILYQVVFSTKFRERTLEEENRDELFKYINGVLTAKKCLVFQIGGVEDHVHLLFSLHPSQALSSLIKDVKLASSDYIKRMGLFKNFGGWQEGFGAFTYSIREKEKLVAYIKNQREHHKRLNSRDEYLDILREFSIKHEERFVR